MITVGLRKRGPGDPAPEAGSIEFRGLRAGPPDADAAPGPPAALSYRCEPPGILPEEGVRRIAEHLTRRLRAGEVDGYDWKVRPGPDEVCRGR